MQIRKNVKNRSNVGGCGRVGRAVRSALQRIGRSGSWGVAGSQSLVEWLIRSNQEVRVGVIGGGRREQRAELKRSSKLMAWPIAT